ncbi:uncharacterized protein LOC128990944 [Macrosteles quadrilineatus]|uniref:uncharacterized protein LOC128988029 n=1 Tax=Macrosteles quadrilineatus TaxID=74068 RepID=UPI0023E32198|nr:uncharacterized protein LOC128988029 [Macrosteles quadrilineatus]XP_054269590.1 uncharacterized protein LOC128990944 [Macrosteles quadrilineatus]
MDDATRIVQTVVILEQGGPEITEPYIEITERSFFFDPNTLSFQEVQPTPDHIDEYLHQQRGGFEIDELTIGYSGKPSTRLHDFEPTFSSTSPPSDFETTDYFDSSSRVPNQTRSTKNHTYWRLPKHLTGIKLLFPGFNYLGPGNEVYNGIPTNEVDEAAKSHDDEYAEVLKKYVETGDKDAAFREFQAADTRFLQKMGKILPKTVTEQLGRFAGKVGITAKRFVEGWLGRTIYPGLD